jgi:tRNA threonylcarbamoyladenosine biosynthesis protein TsaB
MTFQDFLDTKKTALQQSQDRCVLAIDSTTQVASVALYCKGQFTYTEECVRQKSHSEWINGAVERALTTLSNGWEGVDVVAVTQGPGSFTGLRVATNLAKTIAYTKQKPIVSYCSLDLLAQQALMIDETQFVLSAINAFKNMAFISLYKQETGCLPIRKVEPMAIEVANLVGFIGGLQEVSASTKVQVVGDAFQAYNSYFDPSKNSRLVRSLTPKDHPLATTLALRVVSQWDQLRLLHWRELVPLYIRASAAEENR